VEGALIPKIAVDAVTPKRPFNPDLLVERLREAVRPLPKAALFQLADQGFSTPFEVLIACIISIRTLDEVTLPAAIMLFQRARSPDEVSRLSVEEIDALIKTSTFHEAKARQIREIARRVAVEYGSSLPCDSEVLLSLHGVGPKCANLVLGIACGQPRVAADIHVHRVTNRWGYFHTRTPERTAAALEAMLPEQYRVEISGLLVPFGKHICTGRLPRCSTCPLLNMCRQVGVKAHR
jgi:endonuclease III